MSRMHRCCPVALVALTTLCLAGCGKDETASAQSTAAAQASAADGAASAIVKLSTFGQAQYCSIATGTDGTLHALFTDAKKSAEATALKAGGDVGVIMVNTEHTISGMNTVAITGTGRAVEGLTSVSSSSPYVFFTKVKG